MALTIPCNSTELISLEDYIERIQSTVDLRDDASVAESAPLLRALANDRNLVVGRLNKMVESAYLGGSLPTAQAVMLGQGKDFYVRAAIWPSTVDIASGHLYQDQFAYNEAHDHNFSFLTVNYLGPGYETEIYEYDYHQVEGYVGEEVDIRFLEKVRFTSGTVMLYRAGRDIHIQHPPESLSITLNLMISIPEVRTRDQFYFDIANKRITHFPPLQDSSKRVSLLRIAGQFGDGNTRQLLDDLSQSHPCRRTRLSAFESATRLAPAEAEAIWNAACRDPSKLVANEAARQLRVLQG